MKNQLIRVISTVLIASVLLGCGAVSTVTNLAGVGKSAGTVQNLWSDVPPLDGAQKANLDLPLPAQLAVQAFAKASAADSQVQLDKFDLIAFTTSQAPQDVTGFYTQERMAALGWTLKDQPGCTGATNEQGVGGAICIFGKPGTDKQSLLFIALGQDDKTKQTEVFYVRFDGLFKEAGT